MKTLGVETLTIQKSLSVESKLILLSQDKLTTTLSAPLLSPELTLVSARALQDLDHK